MAGAAEARRWRRAVRAARRGGLAAGGLGRRGEAEAAVPKEPFSRRADISASILVPKPPIQRRVLLTQAKDNLSEQESRTVLPANSKEFVMTKGVTDLNKSESEIADNSANKKRTYVVALPANPKEFLMTKGVTDLNKPVAEITENSANKKGTYIAAGNEASPVPTLHQPNLHGEKVHCELLIKTSKNDGQTISSASDLIEEPVGKQAMAEGRLQLTGDNYQEQSIDGIGKNAKLLAFKLEKQINSVDHALQHVNQLHDNMESNEISINDTSSENDSDSSSGSESDGENGKYLYPRFEELENARPPELGMKFPTLEDAHRFYNTHALLTGFTAKRGTNYKRKKYVIECNRSGKTTPAENLNRKRKRNLVNRTQCQAKVIVKLNKGQWELKTVRNEHNHPLCSSPSLTRFYLSHKHMSTEEKSFITVLQQSKIPPKKIMKIFRRMSGSFTHLPLNKKDPTSLQHAEQRRKANSDVERSLSHFKELQLQNPCFSHTVQTDKNSIVKSIFWTDARSRMDYEIFGDFVSFDTTTYSTNRHNMPFAPIIGINDHGRIIMLGCALLQDQKAETFKWMLQTFLQVMGGKMPRTVITDQDEAMTKAIAEVMPQVRHRFCKYHVMRKAWEKLGAFMAARGNMNAELHDLVNNSLTETEFEEGWAALIEGYNASENEHLQLMWQTRKNWVPAYFSEDFCPFIKSTEHSEGSNSLFKNHVLPKDRIERFIEQYEKIQEKMIKTDDEDRLQSGTEPSCFSLQPIEKHAAHVYTRQIFLKVQRELLHSTAFNVKVIQKGAVYRLEKVFNYENPEFDRNSFEVLVEPGTNAFKCQCAKFTRDGILCCHIFRVFTQFGINEIPGEYILPRWTPKFKEEQLKKNKEKCLERHGINHSESTLRYAMLMSKVADIGKEICDDGTKCSIFMLELDKIQEKFAAMIVENPEE